MMSAIKSQFGGADICVNSAGIGHECQLLSGDTEKWRNILEVICCMAFIRVVKYGSYVDYPLP